MVIDPKWLVSLCNFWHNRPVYIWLIFYGFVPNWLCLWENKVSIIGNSRLDVITLGLYNIFFKLTDADGDSVFLIKWSELYALADIFL